MLAIVPVKGAKDAKTRLASRLSPAERADLVQTMLSRVLAACAGAAAVERTLVVTPEPEFAPPEVELLADDGRGHARAIALALADERARFGALVIMADCPLARSSSLDELAAAARPAALVPASDGGVNALALVSPELFEPAFGVIGGAAVTVERARAAGIEPAVLDDPLLALDVDLPEDLDRAILSRA